MTLQDVIDGFVSALAGGIAIGLISGVAYNIYFKGGN